MKPFLSLLFALATTQVYAQQQETTITATEQPRLQYQQYVAQLQAGNTDIDYYAFRLSRLDHKSPYGNWEKHQKLEEELFKKGDADEHKAVIDLAKQMLELDYTDMRAYRYLAYAYDKLGDSASAIKYAGIEKRLMASIMRTGDGKSCATAFEVIDVYEEYHIIRYYGLRPNGQVLVSNEHHTCDRIKTIDKDGKELQLYFGIDKFYPGRAIVEELKKKNLKNKIHSFSFAKG